jgi:hypothetical protein
VWTKNFKTFPAEEGDVEMTGDGEGLGEPSPDEDDFEKQMHLANESDKTEVRTSHGKLSGHTHVKRTYPDVVRMWRQFHGCPGSGGGIERVFTAAGKQHDTLKKSTMDKMLESTLKAGMNTKSPTCDDKGVFTDDEDTYRKRK